MDKLICEILPYDYPSYDLSYKIIIIGDSGVGKSSLIQRASKDNFSEDYKATIGFEFCTFNTKINNKIIRCQVWDTCGQEIYRSLISSFYKSSVLSILVYSIDDKNSFADLNSWINDLKNKASSNIKIFLIGNKVDLNDNRQVEKSEVDDFILKNKIDFFLETSAKTGFNAKNVFIECAKVLYLESLNYQNNDIDNSDSDIIKINNNTPLTEKDYIEHERRQKSSCSF